MSSPEVDSENIVENPTKIPFDINIKDIVGKYEKLKGKSLFLRFPRKLTTNLQDLQKEIKDMCGLVAKVRRPRQKSARFCSVDFDSESDRVKAMKKLKDVEINGKKLIVDVPKFEKPGFVDDLLERRKLKFESSLAANKLKKIAKRSEAKKTKSFTTTLIVKNVPISTKTSILKKNFTDSIDVKIIRSDNDDTYQAAISFPTPKDATIAKRKKIEIDGKLLTCSYANEQTTGKDFNEVKKKATNVLKRKIVKEIKEEKEESNGSESEGIEDHTEVSKPAKLKKLEKVKNKKVGSKKSKILKNFGRK